MPELFDPMAAAEASLKPTSQYDNLDLTARQRQIEGRKARLKEAMAKLQPYTPGEGSMVGGYYVPESAAPAIINAMGQFQNRIESDKLDADEKAYLRAESEAAQKAYSRLSPTVPSDELGGGPVQPEPKGVDRRAIIQTLMDIPSQRGMGGELMKDELLEQPRRAEAARVRQEESALAREQAQALRTQQIEAAAAIAKQASEDRRLSIEQRREAAQQHASLMRELAAGRAAGGAQAGQPGGDFAGPSTAIGINPRDESPIYRHTKSGKLFTFNEAGEAVPHGGAVAPKTAATTEAERTAAGYLGRMTEAEKTLNAQGVAGQPTVGTTLAGKVPGVGGYAQRNIMTEAQGKATQAQQDWVRAKLRKESGAVIGEKEMADEIAAYFPQVGDSKAVIAQKAQSRMQAQEQMKSSAGRVKPTTAAPVGRTVVREVKLKDGRTGVEYSDGTRGYK